MAGEGGAKSPDFKSRVPGVGAASQRMDMADGRGMGVKSTAVTGAPTPGVAPGGQGYGQRSELEQLASGAPRSAPRARGGAGGTAQPMGPPDLAGGELDDPMEPLPAPPPVAPEILAATDPDELEAILPILHMLAAQVDAGPGLGELFDLAGEQVLHLQQSRMPMPMSLDPDPDYWDDESVL